MTKCAYLLVHWGAPYHQALIKPFVKEYVKNFDRALMQNYTPFKKLKLYFLIQKTAYFLKRDYLQKGALPSFVDDLEEIASLLSSHLQAPVLTFYQHLPNTHGDFCKNIAKLDIQEIKILPLFPQYSFSMAGNIAAFFAKILPKETLFKLRWIKSYPTHPAYVQGMQKLLKDSLKEHALMEEKTSLLFFAPSILQASVEKGDLYLSECQKSVKAITKGFPFLKSELAFLPLFSRGRWLSPTLEELYDSLKSLAKKRDSLLLFPLFFFHPLCFLFELEKKQIPFLKQCGFKLFYTPSIPLYPKWLDAIAALTESEELCANYMLTPQR